MIQHGEIALTVQERELLRDIVLDSGDLGHEVYLQNKGLIPKLLKSLIARNAIPAHRLKYFDDPVFRHQGRIKGSYRHLFERNGTTGTEIYIHPNFREFLRYFLFGAQLPQGVAAAFSTEIERKGRVNGTDALELAKFAKDLIRRKHISSYETSEEFVRLCLDCGVDPSHAIKVGQVVKRMR